jgi:hypothetical protein
LHKKSDEFIHLRINLRRYRLNQGHRMAQYYAVDAKEDDEHLFSLQMG